MNQSTVHDSQSLRPRKVLLVEDNPGDAFLVRTLLTGNRFSDLQIISVPELRQAIELLKSGEDIQVALLDLNLPDSAGEETFLQLHESFRSLPIVVFTGMSEARLAFELLAKGAYAYLRKDELTESVLFNTVYGCMKRYDKEQELLRLKEIAEKADQQKTVFLGQISHELRTPLTSILGFTQLLNHSSQLSEMESDQLSKIEKNAKHLKSLISDLLDVSKIESGHVDLSLSDFSLPRLLDDVLNSLKIQADSKNLKLVCRSLKSIPKIINSDPTRLKQILFNVIGNAIKFSDRGSVNIEIDLMKMGNANELVLDVMDSGPGIPLNLQNELFKPYGRLQREATEKEGTGLGLVVARGLARAMDGDVTLKNSTPKGSTFSISIGFKLINPNVNAPYQWPTGSLPNTSRDSRYPQPNLSHLKLLIVEDVEDIRILYDAVMKRFGKPDIEFATTGKEGYEKAMRGNYDALLLDLSLPDEEGTEVAKRLRSNGFSRPIVALTAHALPEYREITRACGFSGYMSKPVDFPKLAQKLLTLTSPEQSSAAS